MAAKKTSTGRNGRPSAYKAEYCEQVKKLCLLGAKDSEIADFFGCAESTLNNWKVRHPKFKAALKSGKDLADAKIAQSLYHRAKGYHLPEDKIVNGGLDDDGSDRGPVVVTTTKRYPPDTTACIFWLKNRRPGQWRDKHEIEQDTKVTVEIVEFKPEDAKK